jgi:integrase
MAPASIGNSRLWSTELSEIDGRITEFRLHDLRHTAATYRARLGATEQQLKAIGVVTPIACHSGELECRLAPCAP